MNTYWYAPVCFRCELLSDVTRWKVKQNIEHRAFLPSHRFNQNNRVPHDRSTIETVEVASVWGPPSSLAEEGVSGASAAAPEASTAPGTLVTVRYVLRAEDIGTGREWLVFPQYSDFSELRQQLLLMWPPIADLPFPAKRPVPKAVALGSTPGTAERAREAVVEDGVVRLEAFLEGAMALLGIYVSIDPR